MKQLYTVVLSLFLTLILGLASVQEVQACDRSEYNLDSVSFDGTNYTIYSTLCIGGGILGGVSGADNATQTFAIGFYSTSGTMALMAPPLPSTITGDSTGCTFGGGGPAPSLLGSNFSVVYQPISPCFNLMCVNSTALCGRPHQQCFQFISVVNEIPDSMVALAIEGTANVNAGCYPGDSPATEDMVIDFTVLLPVVWGSMTARVEESTVEVEWSTVRETNSDRFEVARSANGQDWEVLGTVTAANNSDEVQRYSFVDDAPLKGLNRYRVFQYDLDGQSMQSEVASVSFLHDHAFEWGGIGPVPTRDYLRVSFTSQEIEEVELSLYDLSGKRVLTENMTTQYGSNRKELDLTQVESGVYFLRLNGPSGILNHKVIKE